MQKQICGLLCLLLGITEGFATNNDHVFSDGADGHAGQKRKTMEETGKPVAHPFPFMSAAQTILRGANPPVLPKANPTIQVVPAPVSQGNAPISAFKKPTQKPPAGGYVAIQQQPALLNTPSRALSGVAPPPVPSFLKQPPIVLGQVSPLSIKKTDGQNKELGQPLGTNLTPLTLNLAKTALFYPPVGVPELSQANMIQKGYEHLKSTVANPDLYDEYFQYGEQFSQFILKFGPDISKTLKQLQKAQVFDNAFNLRYHITAYILCKLAEISSQQEKGSNIEARIFAYLGEPYNLQSPPPPTKFTVDDTVSFYARETISHVIILPKAREDKGLRFLPPQINDLKKLELLSCIDNGLHSFGDLHQLEITTLDLSHNNLGFNVERLPKGLLALNLSNNPLKLFCPDVSILTNLKVLALQETGLSGEFDGLSLSQLEQLDVSRNKLAYLKVPSSLEILLASVNDLKALPHGIGLCRKLSCLDLRYNKIASIEAQMLPSTLTQLLLGSGALSLLTNFDLGKFPNLCKIDLMGLLAIPITLLDPSGLAQRRREMPHFELRLGRP